MFFFFLTLRTISVNGDDVYEKFNLVIIAGVCPEI